MHPSMPTSTRSVVGHGDKDYVDAKMTLMLIMALAIR